MTERRRHVNSNSLTRGTPLGIESKTADSISELISVSLSISESLPGDSFLWFRGHSQGCYKLLPTIMRDGKNSADVFERERRLLTRFRQRSMAYWPAGYPQNDWEHLFAMQHYGIPTRLLDWSENLLVAAYFALEPYGKGGGGLGGAHVWCLDPIAWNRSTPALSEYGNHIRVLTTVDEDLEAYRPDTIKRRQKSPVAMFGAHNSARIVAQRGTFIVWGEDAISLEEFARKTSAQLWKIELTGDLSRMMRELQWIGFNETMIFPELNSLASELTRTEGWQS